MGSLSSSATNPSLPASAFPDVYPVEKGRLLSLPTKIELQLSSQIVEVLIATVPLKSASTVLKLVEASVQGAATANLQHLRRFIRPEHLPTYLRNHGEVPGLFNPATKPASSLALPDNNKDVISGPVEAPQQPVLHYLVCPASATSVESLRAIFSSIELSVGINFEPHFRTIPVPLYPPSSEKQAKDWSRDFWPTVYKGANPFGPHRSLVSRTLEDLLRRADGCMKLARRVGEEASMAAPGEPIGAVVVDPSLGESGSVIATAGDARWRCINRTNEPGNGNVMGHAIMRAIGMVARKRRALLPERLVSELDCWDFSWDRPLTTLEEEMYTNTPVVRDGYLCLDMELYVTHEPCVMCSMAILHSRFARVIFGQRMQRTGGLTAVSKDTSDSHIKNGGHGLGYGLFWRQELNWRHLAWQWVTDSGPQILISSQDIHA